MNKDIKFSDIYITKFDEKNELIGQGAETQDEV
jgi:hypothetical protein